MAVSRALGVTARSNGLFCLRRPRSRQVYALAAICVGATSFASTRYLHWNNTMGHTSPLPADLKAPRQPIQWDHSASSIDSAATAQITRSRALLDEIAALPPADCTFETVFHRLADDESTMETLTAPLLFYQYVSTSQDLRDAANAAEKRLNEVC